MGLLIVEGALALGVCALGLVVLGIRPWKLIKRGG
jgi:hypothetical protein